MDDAEAVGRSGGAELGPFEEGHAESPERGISRDAGPVDTAAHDDQIVGRACEVAQVASGVWICQTRSRTR
jgi:hypothetical protein